MNILRHSVSATFTSVIFDQLHHLNPAIPRPFIRRSVNTQSSNMALVNDDRGQTTGLSYNLNLSHFSLHISPRDASRLLMGFELGHFDALTLYLTLLVMRCDSQGNVSLFQLKIQIKQNIKENFIKTDLVVRSGIRTHTYKFSLRPKAAPLDHSAIGT